MHSWPQSGFCGAGLETLAAALVGSMKIWTGPPTSSQMASTAFFLCFSFVGFVLGQGLQRYVEHEGAWRYAERYLPIQSIRIGRLSHFSESSLRPNAFRSYAFWRRQRRGLTCRMRSAPSPMQFPCCPEPDAWLGSPWRCWACLWPGVLARYCSMLLNRCLLQSALGLPAEVHGPFVIVGYTRYRLSL